METFYKKLVLSLMNVSFLLSNRITRRCEYENEKYRCCLSNEFINCGKCGRLYRRLTSSKGVENEYVYYMKNLQCIKYNVRIFQY